MTTQISKYTSDDELKTVLVLWDDEWEEYQVKLWIGRSFQKDATYHTDDLEDAIGTAKLMVK
jgi:hypothetical protein